MPAILRIMNNDGYGNSHDYGINDGDGNNNVRCNDNNDASDDDDDNGKNPSSSSKQTNRIVQGQSGWLINIHKNSLDPYQQQQQKH